MSFLEHWPLPNCISAWETTSNTSSQKFIHQLPQIQIYPCFYLQSTPKKLKIFHRFAYDCYDVQDFVFLNSFAQKFGITEANIAKFKGKYFIVKTKSGASWGALKISQNTNPLMGNIVNPLGGVPFEFSNIPNLSPKPFFMKIQLLVFCFNFEQLWEILESYYKYVRLSCFKSL
jgi:hypothetical protein